MARNKKRKIKKSVVIVGEGITEKIYFEGLRKSENLNIKLKPELPFSTDIAGIVKRAKKAVENEADKIYCTIDLDRILVNEKEQKDYIKQKKQNPKVDFIEINPCFELWFLLHFEHSSREYLNCEKLISSYLKKKIPDYQKKKEYLNNIYDKLKDKQKAAIDNSIKLIKEKSETKSEIHKVIKYLNII